MKTKEDGYIAIGDVRGWCGHLHTVLIDAEECVNNDSAGCVSSGGYSDRYIRVIPAGSDHDYSVASIREAAQRIEQEEDSD